MKIKHLIAVPVMLGIIAGLAGCGNNSSNAKNKDGKEEIRISWWGADSRNKAVQEAITAFEKDNKDIKVKAEFGDYGSYQQKMTTQLSGGTAPDVVRLDSMWLDQYQNQLLDLNELKDEIGLDNFNKEQLESITIDGKLLGMPLSTNYLPLYYNKTVLDKYGIKKPESWDDLFAMRDKLPDNMYPMWFHYVKSKNVSPMFLVSIIAQQTGKPIGDKNNKLQYTEKDFENGLAFYKKLVDKRIIPSKEVIDNAGAVDGAIMPQILDGSWASTWEFTANTVGLKEQLKEKGFELELAGFPAMENQKSTGVWSKPSMVYSIPTTSKHKKAAAKLIDYLMNDEEANKIQKLENGVPDSKTGKEVLEDANLIDPVIKEAIELGSKEVDPSLNYSYRWERSRLLDATLDVINGLDYGEISVKEGAATLYQAFVEEEGTFGSN